MTHREKDEGEGRRSLRAHVEHYYLNWNSFDGPILEKLALTAKNRVRAFTVGKGCCGHPGEPGC